MPPTKPHLAVFAGAGATVCNTASLVTGQQARERHGLAPLQDDYGVPLRYEALRPQRLAAPVTVYIDAFSAHPMELDAADLYGPPDGFLAADGTFREQPASDSDRPVFRLELRPDDGLYPLPYAARQADGRPWEGDLAESDAESERARQPFYPDGERLFEEIDRLAVSEDGRVNQLSSQASFDHYRVLPSAGFRNTVGPDGSRDERAGEDYFAYRPHQHRSEPALHHLARAVNRVQSALDAGGPGGQAYGGAVWMEGSPFLGEVLYWLSLLIDTSLPIVGVASHRPHGVASNDGDGNVIDAVTYICSGIWSDPSGADRVGPVVVEAERIITARDVQKVDARPGGHQPTGGHGGIVGSMGQPGPPVLTFVSTRRTTARSAVRLTQLLDEVPGPDQGRPRRIRDVDGGLLEDAVPQVEVVKHVRFSPSEDVNGAVDQIRGVVRRLREQNRLGGFVLEGAAPYGRGSQPIEDALRMAALSGCPVVAVGRGNAEGFVPPGRFDLGISGNNLTATKARLLLTASLLRWGATPAAADPQAPTPAELDAIRQRLVGFQTIFDEH